jgi:tetratricopeptide (TPR) repeat protein
VIPAYADRRLAEARSVQQLSASLVDSASLRARLLLASADQALALGRPTVAADPSRDAIELFRSAGDKEGQFLAWTASGKSGLYGKKWTQAQHDFKVALQYSPDSKTSAMLNMYLAQTNVGDGDWDSAYRYMDKALPMIASSGDTPTKALAFQTAGAIAIRKGNVPNAREYLTLSAGYFDTLGDAFTSGKLLSQSRELTISTDRGQFPSHLVNLTMGLTALIFLAYFIWRPDHLVLVAQSTAAFVKSLRR